MSGHTVLLPKPANMLNKLASEGGLLDNCRPSGAAFSVTKFTAVNSLSLATLSVLYVQQTGPRDQLA